MAKNHNAAPLRTIGPQIRTTQGEVVVSLKLASFPFDLPVRFDCRRKWRDTFRALCRGQELLGANSDHLAEDFARDRGRLYFGRDFSLSALSSHLGQVIRAAVTDRHRGIGSLRAQRRIALHQHHRQRFTNDVAATNDRR